MTSFLSSLFKSSKAPKVKQKVAMITNFSACPLGLKLLDRLSESNQKVIAVSHDASRFDEKYDKDRVNLFEAFPNEEEDRIRLMSYLLENEMEISTLVQN